MIPVPAGGEDAGEEEGREDHGGTHEDSCFYTYIKLKSKKKKYFVFTASTRMAVLLLEYDDISSDTLNI